MNDRLKCFEFLKRQLLFIVCLVALLHLSGCSTMYDLTGHGVVMFGEDRVLPYIMASDNTSGACSTAEGVGPAIGAFGPVVNKFKIFISLGAFDCEKGRSVEQEFRYLKAMRNAHPIEAQDALNQQKKHLAEAAKRAYEGYNAYVAVYGEPGGECPSNENVFGQKNETDELYQLIGMLNGVFAVTSDMSSDSLSGIPIDMIPRVLRGLQCLDNERWWGLPQGVEALVSIMLMDDTAQDPYKEMERAVATGNAQGVRLVQTVEAMLYLGQGKKTELRNMIRNHVDSKKTQPSNPQYRFLDAMATKQIQVVSDLLWVEATGMKTPFNKLGTFWNDKIELSEAIDIDSLL